MPAKKTSTTSAVKKLKTELEKSKKEAANFKKKQAAELLKLAEDAYYAGYMDAMVDMDEKAEAMDKCIEKALTQFEKEYAKKLTAPKKSKKRK